MCFRYTLQYTVFDLSFLHVLNLTSRTMPAFLLLQFHGLLNARSNDTFRSACSPHFIPLHCSGVDDHIVVRRAFASEVCTRNDSSVVRHPRVQAFLLPPLALNTRRVRWHAHICYASSTKTTSDQRQLFMRLRLISWFQGNTHF